MVIDSHTVKKPAFISLTNSGYLDFTRNCLASLKACGFEAEPRIYCADRAAGEALSCAGHDARYCGIDDDASGPLAIFGSREFGDIALQKIRVIHRCLLDHEFVLFTDADVTFEDSQFFPYLLEHIQGHELLIQNACMEDADHDNLCTGFWLIRSTENTRGLLDPVAAIRHRQSWVNENWQDQCYINAIKQQFDYALLPLELFPNGAYYRRNSMTINPYMVHHNWVLANEKESLMRKFGKWYLKPQWMTRNLPPFPTVA